MNRSTKFSIEIDLDAADLELIVEGNATPYDPGNTSGPVEACYPPEGGEVEIENVWLTAFGDTHAVKVEITPLLLKLDAFDKLQELTEQALANREPDDEPDHPED